MITAFEPALLIDPVLSAWEPNPDVRTWDWINENGRMHNGQPFDGDRVPWLEGVCDAYDDPTVRTLSLMWGTRLGKTSGAFQIMACMMATAPMPGLFSSSTQSLVKRAVTGKIYPILRAIEATRVQLLSESMEKIRLTNSTWHVAWSGSATALADLDAYYGHAGEIDKWSYNESQGGEAGEGDPLDQFDERFKEHWDFRKQIYECSPTTKLKSRINKKLLKSNNCRFHVPCPKCKNRQVLKMGGADAIQTGGIVFDKLPDGTYDRDLARNTARYVCEHCRKEIHDELRFAMMRSGVWVPAGCYADKRGRVLGTPFRTQENWGSQLSSLYSLQMGWGDIAAKFIDSRENPKSLQMFVNGWKAEVWEPHRSKSEPEEVAERMRTETPEGVIPEWATWVFRGGDVQEEFMVHVAIAVGPGERWTVIDHGIIDTWEEFEQVIKREYKYEDGNGSLPAALTLIDSAHRTKEVYDFCQGFKKTKYIVQPCKGANNDCNGEPYQKFLIGDGTKSGNKRTKRLALAARGLIRVRVSPFHYEPIIQRDIDQADETKRLLSLAADAADDFEFIEQICNGAMSERESKTSPGQYIWVKRWDDKSNDYRDCLKYARCAADVKFRGDWRKALRRQLCSATEEQKSPAMPSAGKPAAHPENRQRRTRERFRNRTRETRTRRRR